MSKTTKKILLIISLLALSVFSFACQAQQTPQQAAEELAGDSPITSIDSVVNIMKFIIKYLYVIFGLVAVVFILGAAWDFLSDSGDGKKKANGGKKLLYASIAVVIVLLASSFSLIVNSIIEKGSKNNSSNVQNRIPLPW